MFPEWSRAIPLMVPSLALIAAPLPAGQLPATVCNWYTVPEPASAQTMGTEAKTQITQ